MVFFFFQAEDGIRDRSPSRGLGDVYKRQARRPSGHKSEAGDSPTGAGRGAQATGRRPVPRWVRSGMMARQARFAPHRRTVVSPSMIKRPVPLTLTARRTPSKLTYWRTL